MFSKPLPFVLLALACITAAAGAGYVAKRQNATDATVVSAPAAQPAPVTSTAATPATPPAPAAASTQPVAETEAAVTPVKSEPAAAVVTARKEKQPVTPAASRRQEARPARTPAPVTQTAREERAKPSAGRTVPMTGGTAAATEPQPSAAAPVPAPSPDPVKPIEAQPEAPRQPQFEEVILPVSSVIGLQLESTLSSERARVEDRVDARVTRDVLAAGRVAIPAGSRVLGSVTVVERGGKVKERARLGVRFHTLILADGSELPLHTDAVYREGESPAGNSAKKIGGAAVGGAILGAILGGGKGAAIGGATGAAGGTAAVMTGDRSAATLNRGEVVTAKLSAPATITVERRE